MRHTKKEEFKEVRDVLDFVSCDLCGRIGEQAEMSVWTLIDPGCREHDPYQHSAPKYALDICHECRAKLMHEKLGRKNGRHYL